jgi:hypothetical protein
MNDRIVGVQDQTVPGCSGQTVFREIFVFPWIISALAVQPAGETHSTESGDL